MLFSPSFLRVLRRMSVLLCAAGAVSVPAQTCTTTIAGKVYSPLGPGAGDPIPNILVYVASAPVAAFTTAGPGSCGTPADSVSGSPIVSTTTDAAGSFSLTSTGISALASPVNVVIQAGKWRRQNSVAITPCTTNTVNLTMPANQSQGDLPHIAVVTGEADGIECIFRRIGISDSEFTDPGGGGSINLYEGSGTASSGGAVVNPADNPVPKESDLIENSATLNSYDLVMFGCQGTPTDTIASADTNHALENLVSYANTGGRIFATHYGYVWLDNIQPFESSADWLSKEAYSSGTGVIVPATINPNYSQSAILSQWLQNVGASYNNVQGQVGLQQVRVDTGGVNNPPAQSWVNLNTSVNYTGNPSVQFTFDTPVNVTGTPSVALSFINNPVVFHPGDAADDVTINVSDTSATTAADNSLNMKLVLPSGVAPVSLTGANPGTGWVCSVATLTCNRTTALAAATTDPVLLVLSVAANPPLGDSTITATIAGGGLSGTNQCGRVLYNDYHVEIGASTGEKYPKECQTVALTAQEKFLEFSLYNLSNFVAPVTTDVIDIQGITQLTWPAPLPVPYGTPLSGTQLDASSTYNGVTVPGTYTYAPSTGTVLNTGNNTLNVTFTPADTTSYSTVSGSTTLVVTQDTTTTSVASSLNPSYLNQNVTFTATVTGSNAPPTGMVNFYDNGNLIGTGNLNATTGDVSTATFSTSILTLGSHNITASYANTLNFGPSASGILVQVVTLIPSSIAINGLVSPIYYGQIIGNVAVVTVTGFGGGGTSNVYIDNVLVCTLPVNAGMTSSCPPSTGVGYNSGNHTVYATYSGDAQYAPSTSPTYNVTILPDNTTTVLTSSVNPALTTQTVTLTATVTALYAAPVGAVTFSYNGQTLAVVPLSGQGTASFTGVLPAGPDTIVASYPASLNFNASSTSLLEQVNIPMPHFDLSVSPNPMIVLVNSVGVATVTTTDEQGFSQPVQLTCSGLPAETICSFTQSLLPATGGSTQVMLTPAPPHDCKVASAQNTLPGGRGLWLAFMGLGLVFARRRRRLLQGLALIAALLILPMLNGCGNCTDLGVIPGNYSITITGTSTGTPVLTNSVTLTMKVTY